MHIAPIRKAILPALTLLGLLTSFSLEAQLSSNMQSMMRRIDSGEFSGGGEARGGGGRRGARPGGERRWIEGGRGYSTLERGELVRYDTATGSREVLMSAKALTPPKSERALAPVESGSTNANQMLFATNPRAVMIRKTANDYWVLDKAAASWHKLGGKTNSGLLYAKLSPDGT